MIKKIFRLFLYILVNYIKYSSFDLAMKIRNVSYYYLLNNMGHDCNIKDAVTIQNPKNINLGNRVSIHMNCILDGSTNLDIGNNVGIGANSLILTSKHNFYFREKIFKNQGMKLQPVKIGNNVMISANVVILPGITIGDNCFIGANVTINKNIPNNSIVSIKNNLSIAEFF